MAVVPWRKVHHNFTSISNKQSTKQKTKARSLGHSRWLAPIAEWVLLMPLQARAQVPFHHQLLCRHGHLATWKLVPQSRFIWQDMESDQDRETWCNMQFRYRFWTGSGKPMPRLQAAIVWWSFKVSTSLVYDCRKTCHVILLCVICSCRCNYLPSNVWHHLIWHSGRKALDEPFDQLQAWMLNRREAYSATCITSGRGAAQQKDRLHVASCGHVLHEKRCQTKGKWQHLWRTFPTASWRP